MQKVILATTSENRILLSTRLTSLLSITLKSQESFYPELLPLTLLPTDYVIKTAHGKVSAIVSEDIVIGCDTVVVVDGEIIGKPRDVDHAREILMRLSGRTHRVLTGVVIRKSGMDDETRTVEFASETIVYFGNIEVYLSAYLASNDWKGKAGGYGIQGLAALFIEKIEGDYYTVVGLPIAMIAKVLISDFKVSMK